MSTSSAVRFGVVGSGRRAAFFLRLARMAPDRLQVAGVVTRSAERAERVQSEWGVPAHRSLGELAAAGDVGFVVAAVPWAVMPDAVTEAVGSGVRVLAETPPAPTAEGLSALWAEVGASGLVQVAEQYLLMPGHAARLAAVREGVVGAVSSVQVSSTHQYHAVAMIRGLLGVGFDRAEVTARAFTAAVVDPLTPQGWTGGGDPVDRVTTVGLLDFGAGRSGVYDFVENQWWNPLRHRRIVIRGSRGEIADDSVLRLVDPTTPVESLLVRRQLGVDLNLEGVGLDHISLDGQVVYRNPFPGAGFSDDDLAVADILARTGAWARGDGPEPYPLAQACQDHLLALGIEQAARERRSVTVDPGPWAP